MCCAQIDALVSALKRLIDYSERQYLSQELREATTEALVALANAEVAICPHCGRNQRERHQ